MYRSDYLLMIAVAASNDQTLDGLFAELGMASLRERWRKQKNFSVAAALQKSDTDQPAAIPIAEQPKPPVLTVETRPHSYYTVSIMMICSD